MKGIAGHPREAQWGEPRQNLKVCTIEGSFSLPCINVFFLWPLAISLQVSEPLCCPHETPHYRLSRPTIKIALNKENTNNILHIACKVLILCV